MVSTSPAITGNGSTSGSSEGTNAKITINGGEIKANRGPAIYAPQPNGDTTINGGVLTGESGIEIRAGKLTITGGTLNATAEEYKVISNTSGTTTTGAAVAIAQHTTVLPIDVNITGGRFNGVVPFSLQNPEDNPEEATQKVKVSIIGGKFDGEDYEDLYANISEGYVSVTEDGLIIVMSESEAIEREEAEKNEQTEEENKKEILPVPDTGFETAEFAKIDGANSDIASRIIVASIAGIIVTIGSFVLIRRRANSESK